MRKPRRAKLQVQMTADPANEDGLICWVRLVASNGEPLMHSETYASSSNARRAKADIEAAMMDYLRSKGYLVAPPGHVVTKAEEASR